LPAAGSQQQQQQQQQQNVGAMYPQPPTNANMVRMWFLSTMFCYALSHKGIIYNSVSYSIMVKLMLQATTDYM